MKQSLLSGLAAVCIAGATQMAQAEPPKSAFLGVVTMPVNPALASHLDLDTGFGLVVTHVVPDSPAAGTLALNDVLTKVADQRLVSQHQLRTLLASEGVGAQVALEFVHKGQTVQKTVTLAERKGLHPHAMGWHPGAAAHGNVPHMRVAGPAVNGLVSSNVTHMLNPKILTDMLKQMDISDVKCKSTVPTMSASAIVSALTNGSTHVHGNTTSTTSINSDGTQVTVSGVNGKQHMTIKTSNGDTVFDGPVNTEEEKEAIPEEYKDLIQDTEGLFQIQINTTP